MKLPPTIQAVVSTVLGPDGHSEQGLRTALFDAAKSAVDSSVDSGEISPQLEKFARKLIDHPYKLIDSDIEDLRLAGLNEDEIFELTVATALGAGVGRMLITQKLIAESK